MELPEEVWIDKEQIIAGLMIDIQKSIAYPGATVTELEWKIDGVMAHIKYEHKK